MTDAITLITRDHREMEKLFDRLEKERDQRPQLLKKVAAMLTAHSRAEEAEVYPAAATEAQERDEIEHASQEHEDAERLLHELESLDPDSEEFDATLREFVGMIKEHVEEEETEILPTLRDAVDEQRLEELGREFTERREQELARLSGSHDGATGTNRVRDKTKDELYQQARKLDVEGRSGMNKDELASAVEQQKR